MTTQPKKLTNPYEEETKENNESFVDVYKREILETRITVSGIFSKRDFQSKTLWIKKNLNPCK